jgi:hypothetical protein
MQRIKGRDRSDSGLTSTGIHLERQGALAEAIAIRRSPSRKTGGPHCKPFDSFSLRPHISTRIKDDGAGKPSPTDFDTKARWFSEMEMAEMANMQRQPLQNCGGQDGRTEFHSF